MFMILTCELCFGQVSALLSPSTGATPNLSIEVSLEDVRLTQTVPLGIENVPPQAKPKRTYKPRAKKQVSGL